MNKEDSIKEKFKQALTSTFKVISEDYKIKNKDQKKLDEEIFQISELDNINDKSKFTKLRAETDSKALKKKFSNSKVFVKNIPKNTSCQNLYKTAEKIRYEVLGSKMLKGISKNFYENYNSKLMSIKTEKSVKIGDEIKYNDNVIGKILIDKPYPFALIKLFDPEFSVFKDKTLKINNDNAEIIS